MVEYPRKLKAQLLSMKIMAVALIMGLIMFFGVALFVNKFELNTTLNFLTKIALVKACILIPVGFIATKIMLKKRQPETIDGLGAILQTSMLLGYAIIDSAAMFNLVAYLFYQSIFSLFVGLVAIIVMLLLFPRKAKVDHMIFMISDQ